MAFINEEQIYRLTEGLLGHLFKEVLGQELELPFPRLTYDEALARYGTDKPDTRFGMELVDVTKVFANSNFQVFARLIEAGGMVKAINLKGQATLPRSELGELGQSLLCTNWCPGSCLDQSARSQLAGASGQEPK